MDAQQQEMVSVNILNGTFSCWSMHIYNVSEQN
jgi:hypothetical protein